ncbi:MAG: hypothetical protein KTR31_27790 [Myxococcales bacterium]|nr:hypothetical protein [Myxococcales bacterium]
MNTLPFIILWATACGDQQLEALPDDEVELPELECTVSADCAEGEGCWVDPVASTARCVPACETNDDCPGEQLCRTMFETRACVDPLPEPPPPPEPDPEDGLPVTPGAVQCFGAVNGSFDLPFSVPTDATSVMVVPFAPDGGQVALTNLVPPAGVEFSPDFLDEAFFLGTSASLLGSVGPLFLPQFPSAGDALVPGDHTLVVDAVTDDLCVYTLVETAAAGRVVDINLIFVGLDDLDAGSAAQDADLASMLSTFVDIYAAAGIEIGNVFAVDAPPQVASEFAIIETDSEIAALVATSEPPGLDDEALLSVNVFLVAEIALAQGNVLGISQGIPGPAGLHGSPGSGVVVTAENLRFAGGGPFTGQVMAHEVGHWLGLFHTTETRGTVDPIPDTPGCLDIQQRVGAQIDGCPDRFNMMFPFADPAAQTMTTQQADVLVANPVTR